MSNSKDGFFMELKAIKDQAPTVWVAMGDFNTLLSLYDKNGTPSSIPVILQFRAVINEIGLLDLPLLNRAYTWSNGRRHPILERLDRAFISQGWLASFPSSKWRAHPRPRSDHSPLVLSAFSFLPASALFRFETYWLRYSGLPELVSNAWLSPATASALDPFNRFKAKLEQVQQALKEWSAGLSSASKI